eukprot:5252669-Amphidinium_carterae.1
MEGFRKRVKKLLQRGHLSVWEPLTNPSESLGEARACRNQATLLRATSEWDAGHWAFFPTTLAPTLTSSGSIASNLRTSTRVMPLTLRISSGLMYLDVLELMTAFHS